MAMLIAPLGASAQVNASPAEVSSLLVKPHIGAEAIDVSGRGPAVSTLTITLVSTFSSDLPDVVLSRTSVETDAGGSFSTVISIAAGYVRQSILTVYATSSAGGPAVMAQYLVDAPNRGVVVPLDQVPSAVR
jgi:hypothetical protein